METMEDRPLDAGARVARIWQYAVALLQLRVRQTQDDARAAVRHLLTGVVFGLIALVLVLLTLPLLAVTSILALATVMPAWLAALVVLFVLLAVAAGLLVMARARLRWRGISMLADLRADWRAIREKLEESP